MNKPKEITVREAADMVRAGAQIVDIREAPEVRSGMIPGAIHAPLSTLGAKPPGAEPGRAVIFHCKSGGRTGMNAAALAQTAPQCEVYLLKGGIDAWRNAGLPLVQPSFQTERIGQ